MEAELGVALPADFKELSRRFLPGAFSGFLSLLRPTGEHDEQPLLSMWSGSRQVAGRSEFGAQIFAPYGIYGPDTGPGLIQWGLDETEGDHFWLADRAVEPDRWPVVSRREAGEPWHRFDMSTAEFVYRMIADPEFKPFTIADPARRAFYYPYWAPYPISPEDWEALSDPNRRS
ncbi:SMI1/KNR4 family protein [Salinispora sp. H7-4]|uniref:SMI1/KNR4 family protein n=1 Tax=Salinispora sp. H7-4 TaxID=2748321 RepID=UPI0015D2AA00|nr:SMI1/KNR4 family protein [Salinispora sp. H7-4]NYT95326.1 SMI1/KNR4 family protein [Salinispora sp. H7-4]